MSNDKAVFFKIIVIIIFMLFILSLHNLLALVLEIRPQTVITYSVIGVFISYSSLAFYDKLIIRKDEPLPQYIIEQLEVQKQEQDIIKEFLAQEYNITYEEIEVRAKVRNIVEKKNNES